MWEDLTVALSCLGFAAAITVMMVELLAVLDEARTWSAQRGHHV